MVRYLRSAITNDTTLFKGSTDPPYSSGSPSPGMTLNGTNVRLYLPVVAHSYTFSDNPMPIQQTNNDPEGILPHETVTSTLTKSTNNVVTNGFGNSVTPYGAWEMTLALRGTLQRVTVYDATNNTSGSLPQDATDARGNTIYGSKEYLLKGTQGGTDAVYGMTGDQIRNNLAWLAARQSDFGAGSNPLYYMYPYWYSHPETSDGNADGNYTFDRLGEPEHFFRGFIRSISVNDEVGTREAYDFTITFVIANVAPTS